jgi:hypothetical protein
MLPFYRLTAQRFTSAQPQNEALEFGQFNKRSTPSCGRETDSTFEHLLAVYVYKKYEVKNCMIIRCIINCIIS